MLIYLIFFLCAIFNSQAEEFAVYEEIEDICNPTTEELQKIQRVLSESIRPDIKYLSDKEYIPREFKFIGDSPDEMPQRYHVAVNCNENERENCIIIYSSFNQRYPKGASRLFELIVKSDFKGHVYCQIGGWPNIKGGSLVLAHVPFAFKPCFFREMQSMGYKRVLYLDTSIVPTASLNDFFTIIAKKGYFIAKNYHCLEPQFMRSEVARYFGYSYANACSLLSCSACVFGVDFTNPAAARIIDDWYAAAEDPHAFYSSRSDQTALSLVLHRLNLTDWLPGPWSSLFYIDRNYVKDY